MIQKKTLLLALFVAVMASGAVGGSAFARRGSDDTQQTVVQTETETETEHEAETKVEVEHEVESELTDSQKQRVEERRTEIKQRIEAKKTEVAAKLADKRLRTCEKRQTVINKIFDKATERNLKQLAVFQKIEQRVKEFYVNKNLTADGYDAAVANADEKEAAAIAAIQASAETNFDCSSTDASNPGAAIKEAMQARHSALKDYRTAVKDLILVVKKHHGQQQNGDDATETENETETETSTGGAQ